ncbi:MAG: hypothetical protein ACRDGK_05915, partial [Actinomycetota bacterium]
MPRSRSRYADRYGAGGANQLRRHRRTIVVAAVGVVALSAVILWMTRSPGIPGSPGSFAAEGTTCDEPCPTLEPRVTLRWTPPESGVAPTGYQVLRD